MHSPTRWACATLPCRPRRSASGAPPTAEQRKRNGNVKGAHMYTFGYQRPADRAAAVSAMKGDARFLAGGQSLVQAMKLRLSSAEQLVDLAGVADLKGIKVDGSNVVIGSMTTHAAVAASADVRRAIPALAELAGGIGDQMVRNMGTLGGS